MQSKLVTKMYLGQVITTVISLSLVNCLNNVIPRQLQDQHQAIALVKISKNEDLSESSYSIARPYVFEGNLEFSMYGSYFTDGFIYYACPSEGDILEMSIHHNINDSKYHYIQCSSASKFTLSKLIGVDEELALLLSPNFSNNQLQLYHIGYKVPRLTEIEEPESSSHRDNISLVTEIEEPESPSRQDVAPLITEIGESGSSSRQQVAPLIRFIFDEIKKIARIVKHYVSYIQPLGANFKYDTPYHKEYMRIDVDLLYKINQNEHCREIFQNDGICNSPEMKKGLLKKQLVPHEDFYFPIWKKASFFDAITAPMWKTLLPKWAIVENFIRRLALVVGNVEVYTGTSGIMKLQQSSKDIEMYLGPSSTDPDFKIVIPAYIWKAVLFDNIGILIILHNNPFVDNITKICDTTRPICTNSQWYINNDYYKTGLIYCCKLTRANLKSLLGEEYEVDKINFDEEHLESKLPQNVIQMLLAN